MLARNPIKVLPVELFALDKLEKLDLEHCPLESLPDEIGRLKRLKSLRLEGSRIRSLPPSLSQLSALEIVQVHATPLAKDRKALAGGTRPAAQGLRPDRMKANATRALDQLGSSRSVRSSRAHHRRIMCIVHPDVIRRLFYARERRRGAEAGIERSVGSVGDSYDNSARCPAVGPLVQSQEDHGATQLRVIDAIREEVLI